MKSFAYWYHSHKAELVFKREDNGFDTIMRCKIVGRLTVSKHPIFYYDGQYRDLKGMRDIGFRPIGSTERIGQIRNGVAPCPN